MSDEVFVDACGEARQRERKRFVAKCARAAKKAPKFGKWIPLAKQRPGEQRVLVIRKVPKGYRYIDVVSWWNDDPCGLPPVPTFDHVTHWMPLPQMPEEGHE